MSSGFGLKGKVGRCYPFFADYKHCLQTRENDSRIVCTFEKEDYFECLHHRKEYVQLEMIVDQDKKNKIAVASAGGGGGH